jgi:hypothetical protein
LETTAGSVKDIPEFVSENIESGETAELKTIRLFGDIFEMLKQGGFQIVSGVDSNEVSDIVRWAESCEESISSKGRHGFKSAHS